MADESIQKTIAANLAAEVVGYSRLIEVGKEHTRARLRNFHAKLIDPRIADEEERIVMGASCPEVRLNTPILGQAAPSC